MRILDSNILIYVAKPAYRKLRKFVASEPVYVSAISKVEVFGYHKLNEEEETALRRLFIAATVFPVSDPVIEQATNLRRQKNIGTVDAVIAATALLLGAELVTRNTEDFKWIERLKVVNPFEQEGEI